MTAFSRASTFMWMSSSAVENSNRPSSISDKTVSSPSLIASASLSLMIPVAASMAAWAREPAISCAASRLSNPIEALIASMIASGPAAKRPPHIWFEVVSVMSQPFGGKMNFIRFVILYMALALGANAAIADNSALEALREGDMKKLTFHSSPQAVSQTPFEHADGGTGTLADFQGKHVVLNFWATWCAPCRKEMPMLSELQAEFGGPEFDVVTVAAGRNPPPAMETFFDEIGVDNLPLHRDPTSGLAREMGVLGLPITVILNPQGDEVARLQGDAHWNSDSAKAILTALIDGAAGG